MQVRSAGEEAEPGPERRKGTFAPFPPLSFLESTVLISRLAANRSASSSERNLQSDPTCGLFLPTLFRPPTTPKSINLLSLPSDRTLAHYTPSRGRSCLFRPRLPRLAGRQPSRLLAATLPPFSSPQSVNLRPLENTRLHLLRAVEALEGGDEEGQADAVKHGASLGDGCGKVVTRTNPFFNSVLRGGCPEQGRRLHTMGFRPTLVLFFPGCPLSFCSGETVNSFDSHSLPTALVLAGSKLAAIDTVSLSTSLNRRSGEQPIGT